MSIVSRGIQNFATMQNQLRKNQILRNQMQQQQREQQAAESDAERRQQLGQYGANYLTGGDTESLAGIAAVDPEMASEFQDMRGQITEQDRQEMMDVARTLLPTLRAPPEQKEEAYQQARQYIMERYPEEAQEMGLPEQYDEMTIKTRLAAMGDILEQAEGEGTDFSKSVTQAVTPEGESVFIQPSSAGGAREVEGYRPPPNRRIQTDQFGNSYMVDLDSGEVTPLTPEQAEQAESEMGGETPAEGEAPEQPGGQANLTGAIEEGTGPGAQARTLVNSVVGPFLRGRTAFPETERAQTAIRLFRQEAETALINNNRFPVALVERIQRMLPDPDTFFTDPDAQRERLNELRDTLERRRQLNLQSMQSGEITEDEVGRLANQNAAMDRILGLMGPAQIDISQMSREQLNQLDPESMTDEEIVQAAERYDELRQEGNSGN